MQTRAAKRAAAEQSQQEPSSKKKSEPSKAPQTEQQPPVAAKPTKRQASKKENTAANSSGKPSVASKKTSSKKKAVDTAQPAIPAFRRIKRNELGCAAAKIQTGGHVGGCNCDPQSDCGQLCDLRSIQAECDAKCIAGARCTNNAIRKMKNAATKVHYTGPGKGFGLFAKADIKSGAFIIEFVGELIDQQQFKARAESTVDHKPVYFVYLVNGIVIDATHVGNDSRFINHSCDPNARLVRRTVGDTVRVGIVTVKDVKDGEEITTSYGRKFGYETGALKCHCDVCKDKEKPVPAGAAPKPLELQGPRIIE